MSDLNIKSTTIDKALDLLKDFLSKAIGPTIEEFGLGLSDNIRIRRFKNQLKNLEKAKKIVGAHNIAIKQINLKALFPYLEGVALEEDETLQDIWANMFVNYIDSEKNLTMTVFPEMLKQISSSEVKMLAFMSKNQGHIKKSHWRQGTEDYKEKYSLEEMGNLLRLGLIREIGNFSLYNGNKIEELQPEDYFVSELGYAFLAACQR